MQKSKIEQKINWQTYIKQLKAMKSFLIAQDEQQIKQARLSLKVRQEW